MPELPDLPVDGASTITVTIVDPAPPQPATGRISLELDTGIAADLVLNIASNGTVTGKINMDKANYAITGRFDATGLLTIHFGAATGVGTLTARTLLVQLTDSAAQTYEVTLIDNVLGGQEQGAATATNFNALNPCPFAGAYTCVDNHTLPDSICAFKVDVLGNATVAGKVFDGTVIAATGAVDGAGNLSVGTSLYAGQGRWTLTSVLPTTLLTPATNAFIHLTRPGPANQSVVLPAVDSYTVGALAIYTPPAPGFRMFGPWNTAGTGAAIVTGGGYAAVTTQDLLISMTNVVTLTGGSTIPSLKLTLVPATGLFTGTITPPAIPPAVLPKAVPFCGAIIQGNASAQGGLGFFLNGITEGGVLLQ